MAIGESWSAPEAAAPVDASESLAPGTLLANRYQIVQLLGEGGMGAVYKATDCEFERFVAVKVIRPELARQEKILQRFKQELILARRVTHKNVIRIYDLGVWRGIKFITMDFIEGQDLAAIVRERVLSVEETVKIVRQIGLALEAAHGEGVIHRDLKPQNVMVDGQGKVSVMDFGLARTMEMSGLTQTGTVLGTPEYMSPEQAKGEPADGRSDLFSLGIIFFQMLTGKIPFHADTILASMLKRIQETAPPAISVNPAIPQAISDIIGRCLVTDPAGRCQTATEFVAALDAWAGIRRSSATGSLARVQAVKPPPRTWRRPAVYAAAAVAVAALALGVIFRDRIFNRTPANIKPIKLLVADFDNATGEPVFDGTLEPLFTFAMEGASFVTSYNRAQARQLAGQLKSGASRLDEAVARLVALREGLDVVVSGKLAKRGSGYGLSVKAIEPMAGKTLAATEASAGNREAVLKEVSKLAWPVRKALGDTANEPAQATAAETFTAASIEAAHAYSKGQENQLLGKYEEAARAYTEAIQLDPNFGRAYSGLGVVSRNLGQLDEAKKHLQMALTRIDQMTVREKYRTRGAYNILMGNFNQAREEYGSLVEQYPADTAGYANLAIAYLYLRDLGKAAEQGRKAIEIYPKNVGQRNNVALYCLYAGDLPCARREAQQVLELNPRFEPAYLVLALAELIEGRGGPAAEVYGKLEKISPRGASLAALGLADLAGYENRFSEAAAILEKAIEQDLAVKNNAMAAKKYIALGYNHLMSGRTAPAMAAVDRAVAASKEEGLLLMASQCYLEGGQEAKAKSIAAELAKKFSREPQAYSKLIEGLARLRQGNAGEAIKLIEAALRQFETWIGRFYLARAYLDAKDFTRAEAAFDLCLKRRGEAADLFLDTIPSYRHLPPVHYYLGRARAELNQPAAADSFRVFLSMKLNGEADALVTDARRRVTAR